MDELNNLASLGLVLPSPAYMMGALLFGIVGYAAFRQGRKTSRPSLTWTGVALMVYPYAVPQTWLLWALCCAAGYMPSGADAVNVFYVFDHQPIAPMNSPQAPRDAAFLLIIKS